MKATIEVHYNEPVGSISPLLYGSGFEHLAGAVSLGLDAEMLEGRSFQEDDINEDGVSDKWRPRGRGEHTVQFSLDGDGAFHGDRSQRISVITSENVEWGVEQGGKYIRKGEKYHVSLYLRQEGLGRNGSVRVYFATGEEVCAEAVLDEVSSEWSRHVVSLVPNVTSAEASFVIALAGRGSLWIDQVSLMPDHTYRRHDTRADIVEAVVDLGPTLIRWPGGWFAEVYCWKDGVGNPDHRPITRKYHSTVRRKCNPSWEDNHFGTDEFIQFCRDIGAEPVLVVNSGYEEEGVNLDERIAEAADWVEYCNGPETSKFGAMRAANGHPPPYGVRYWEVGNEPWGMAPEAYAQRLIRFARPMKERDPTIEVIASGGNAYDRHWNETVIAVAGGHFDHLDLHYYFACDDYLAAMAEPLKYGEFIEDMSREISSAHPEGKRAGISILEWNSNSTWIDASKLKEGLYAASFLNMLERQGARVTQSGLWPLLRKVQPPGNHASDHSLVWYDNHRIFLTPTALAFQLYRRHFAPERLLCDVDCETFDVPDRSGVPYLDVVATRDEARSILILKVVNRNPANPIEASVITAGAPADPGRAEIRVSTLTGPDVNARNDLCNPAAVGIVDAALDAAANDFTYIFPPHSVTVMQIRYDSPNVASS